MKSCNRIFKLMRILSAIIILWSSSVYITSANAHQKATGVTTDIASVSLRDASKVENSPHMQHQDQRYCASTDHTCHAGVIIFTGLGRLLPRLAGNPVERLIDRYSSRLFPPLHKPPIQTLSACA